ncbi:MAG TPA: histidine phosphatase family protein [Acidimicrobiales bacterium]|nr:histidine phosphatase family protein [Acidimicrobiales bacterium]
MLILVRHGQTEVNAGGRLQGRIDARLTELGRRQAQAAAASVAAAVGGRTPLVVSSPLVRAVETASFISPDHIVDERWIELDYGELDGKPLAEVPPELWARWRSDPAFAPPGGESLLALGRRVRESCEELRVRAIDDDVVVVSHVSPIKAAAAWALGVGDEVSWRMFLDVAAITRLRVTESSASLVSWNERSHLATL